MTKTIKLTLASMLFAAFALEFSGSVTGISGLSLFSTAEAKVGRPLTPVSVAGVARRTGRRCANGTYNC